MHLCGATLSLWGRFKSHNCWALFFFDNGKSSIWKAFFFINISWAFFPSLLCSSTPSNEGFHLWKTQVWQERAQSASAKAAWDNWDWGPGKGDFGLHQHLDSRFLLMLFRTYPWMFQFQRKVSFQKVSKWFLLCPAETPAQGLHAGVLQL